MWKDPLLTGDVGRISIKDHVAYTFSKTQTVDLDPTVPGTNPYTRESWNDSVVSSIFKGAVSIKLTLGV